MAMKKLTFAFDDAANPDHAGRGLDTLPPVVFDRPDGGKVILSQVPRTFMNRMFQTPATPPREGEWKPWTTDKTYSTPEDLGKALQNGIPLPEAVKAFEDFRRREIAGISKCIPKISNARRRRILSDDGDSIDAERVESYRDVESCWEVFTKTPGKKIIRLGMLLSGNATRGAEFFRESVMRATVAANALVAAGYGVQIVGFGYAHCFNSEIPSRMHSPRGTDWLFTVPVVMQGEVISERKLLSYATPGFLRWYGFRIQDAAFPLARFSGRGSEAVITPEAMAAAGIDVDVQSPDLGKTLSAALA